MVTMIRLRTRRRPGFTLFETIVAMFVVLMGLLGIIATFSVGMKARVMSQELLISQELATMWADWVRFRLNDTGAGGPNVLKTSDLKLGIGGDFFEDTNIGGGNLHIGGGNAADLPTYKKLIYQGYTWEIKAVKLETPQWIPANTTDLTDKGGALLDWSKRKDGNPIYPDPSGSFTAQGLTNVQLRVWHNGRPYDFNYTFSGIGLKY